MIHVIGYVLYTHGQCVAGGVDHAGVTADRRADRHAAVRTASEYPHPQGADKRAVPAELSSRRTKCFAF